MCCIKILNYVGVKKYPPVLVCLIYSLKKTGTLLAMSLSEGPGNLLLLKK